MSTPERSPYAHVLEEMGIIATAETALPRWFYEFRMHMGMTQEEFAGYIGASTGSVQKYEYGRQRPNGMTMRHLATLASGAGFRQPPDVPSRRGPYPRKEE